jgi:hypothetical protein
MISELLNIVKAGARSNKYRILIPTPEGKIFDILCTSTTLPGRNITPTEVVIKGKKTLIAGETQWAGTWQTSFYNDIEFSARVYFWLWMEVIHNPVITDYTFDEYMSKKLTHIDNVILDKFNEIENIYNSIVNSFGNNNNIIGNTLSFYQIDLIVEQLDENEEGVHAYKLIGAFPVNVDDVQLNDSEGDVSQTSVTFAYTNIELVY